MHLQKLLCLLAKAFESSCVAYFSFNNDDDDTIGGIANF